MSLDELYIITMTIHFTAIYTFLIWHCYCNYVFMYVSMCTDVYVPFPYFHAHDVEYNILRVLLFIFLLFIFLLLII